MARGWQGDGKGMARGWQGDGKGMARGWQGGGKEMGEGNLGGTRARSITFTKTRWDGMQWDAMGCDGMSKGRPSLPAVPTRIKGRIILKEEGGEGREGVERGCGVAGVGIVVLR